MANQGTFYHVFLSFRGETRDTFTCFLYDALIAEGFQTFMDRRAITAGDEVDSTIKDGIKGSMSAIIVLSQDYAGSTWCLDELLLILERNKTSRYLIIPILYDVKSADIKHQRGRYGDALQKHKARHGDDKVEKWRQALAEVGNLLGEHVQGMQNVFIQNIVKLFREKFIAKFPEFRHELRKTPLPPQGLAEAENKNLNTIQVQQQNHGSSSSGSYNVVFYRKEHNWKVDHIRWHLRNVKFIERNCLTTPEYISELKNLVGEENVRFPMLFVNGKDVSEIEDPQVEGLEDCKEMKDLKSALNYYLLDNPTAENIAEYSRLTGY